MTPDLIAWLTAPQDVHERQARIAEYLANEGYRLPPLPADADYDEAGAIPLGARPGDDRRLQRGRSGRAACIPLY